MTPLDHVAAIGEVLDRLGIEWVLGGSLASSIFGEPRSTMDIDIAIDLSLDAVAELVGAVEDAYYVSHEQAVSATVEHRSFNLIHYATGMKIDVFPLADDPLDVRQLRDRRTFELTPGRTIWVGSPEVQILRKLRWFRLGGDVSERQWRDVIAIIRVQGGRIDHAALLADAAPLGLAELAARAVAEAHG